MKARLPTYTIDDLRRLLRKSKPVGREGPETMSLVLPIPANEIPTMGLPVDVERVFGGQPADNLTIETLGDSKYLLSVNGEIETEAFDGEGWEDEAIYGLIVRASSVDAVPGSITIRLTRRLR